jgi:hypothetical protein
MYGRSACSAIEGKSIGPPFGLDNPVSDRQADRQHQLYADKRSPLIASASFFFDRSNKRPSLHGVNVQPDTRVGGGCPTLQEFVIKSATRTRERYARFCNARLATIAFLNRLRLYATAGSSDSGPNFLESKSWYAHTPGSSMMHENSIPSRTQDAGSSQDEVGRRS